MKNPDLKRKYTFQGRDFHLSDLSIKKKNRFWNSRDLIFWAIPHERLQNLTRYYVSFDSFSVHFLVFTTFLSVKIELVKVFLYPLLMDVSSLFLNEMTIFSEWKLLFLVKTLIIHWGGLKFTKRTLSLFQVNAMVCNPAFSHRGAGKKE